MCMPWADIVDNVLMFVITGLIGWVAGGVASAARRSKEKDEALRNGVMALLRSELMRTHHQAVRQGHASTDDKEVMERTYRAYHDLGGNGLATRLYEEMMALPTKEDK